MDLQTDEAAGVRLVHRVIHDVFHRVSVHPGLDPWAVRDDTQLVPTLVDEVGMSLVDLLLRRQPVRPHRLAIEEAGRRLAFIAPANLYLWPVHPPGCTLETASRHGHRTDLAPDLNPRVGDAIDRGLELELEVVELLQGAEERVHARAALDGPADNGAVLDGEPMR